MAGADRPVGDVMGDDHPDRRLDRVDIAAEGRRTGRRGGDRAVVDVVDGVVPQRKDLRQATADLVDQKHDAEGLVAVEPRFPRCREGHGIEIVVAELPGRPPLRGVVAEVRAVGIPLPHRRGVGRHPLLDRHRPTGPEADRPPAPDGRG